MTNDVFTSCWMHKKILLSCELGKGVGILVEIIYLWKSIFIKKKKKKERKKIKKERKEKKRKGKK